MSALKSKTRYCHYCGANSGAADFCGVCYQLVSGEVKSRSRAARKFGNPGRARLVICEALDGLRASGVVVPARRKEAA